jgi:hypothetical protein
MKRFLSLLALSGLGLAISSGQTPASSQKDAERVVALVQEVQAQQAQIADNQTKIDTKMADLTEAIRLARLSAGKAGK